MNFNFFSPDRLSCMYVPAAVQIIIIDVCAHTWIISVITRKEVSLKYEWYEKHEKCTLDGSPSILLLISGCRYSIFFFYVLYCTQVIVSFAFLKT